MEPTGRTSFALVRTDGQVLVAHPSDGDDLYGPPDEEEVPEAIRRPNPYGVTLMRFGEREEWLTAFRQVGQQPLVVAVTLSMDLIMAEWRRNTLITGLLCLAAALALGYATWHACRRWRSEQATLATLRAEISRREAAEANLAQAQRLESLGRLTGGVAHDFNNLLTAILGTVHLLERHLGATMDDRTRRLLGAARDAVRRGAGLNRSLLAFARRQKLDTASLDVNELVQGFTPLIQRALGEAVTLELDLEQDLPPGRADAAQLESALLNLALNARDAMPRGGTVTVTTRRSTLDAAGLRGNSDAKPGSYIALAVRDDGDGMPAEVRDRAFEPFFTTKPVGRGTGLGLSQVFGFMRQLGGHVALESTAGIGTLVTLYLPESDEPAVRPVAPPPVPAEMPAVARATVLLVEDDERVREVAAETLREAGFRVIAAHDGSEALGLIRRGEQFDVLFSDIVMPGGIDGIEVASAARVLRPGLPVLLATGYAGRGTDSAEHGFEVIGKPYDQVAVVKRIGELAAGRKRNVA
jgi:signal transduction histidine kinase